MKKQTAKPTPSNPFVPSRPATVIEDAWVEYRDGLDNLVTSDQMWYDRLRTAFQTGMARGYAAGYEDGREASWQLVQARDEAKYK